MSSRTEPLVRVQGAVSIARLHGRACCWNIVSCGCHKAPSGSDI
ncbi:hypothetical protein AB0929_06280 [Streptomyces massasporeus]